MFFPQRRYCNGGSRKARLARGLSQKQLGIEAGLDEFVASTRVNPIRSRRALTRLPHGRPPREGVGVPVAYLYCDSEELARLLLAFQSATKTARRQAISVLSDGTA